MEAGIYIFVHTVFIVILTNIETVLLQVSQYYNNLITFSRESSLLFARCMLC